MSEPHCPWCRCALTDNLVTPTTLEGEPPEGEVVVHHWADCHNPTHPTIRLTWTERLTVQPLTPARL